MLTKLEIAEKLKTARITAGMTQVQVAKEIGRKQQTLASWEIGQSQPDANTLFTLCKIYGVSVDGTFGFNTSDTSLTPSEQTHIKKYRALDEHGKEVVDDLLNSEHERILRFEQERQEKERLERERQENRKIVNFPVKSTPEPDEEEPETVEMPIYEEPAAAGIGNYLVGEGEYDMLTFPADKVPSRADFGIKITGDSMEPRIHDGEIVWIRASHKVENGEIGIFVLDGKSLCKKLHIDYDKGIVTLVSLNSTKYRPIVIRNSNELRTIGRVLGKGKWDNWG